MSENVKAALSLIAIAVLAALVQTADFYDQQRIESESSAAQDIYLAVRSALVKDLGEKK